MINLSNIEFYGTPSGEIMIKEQGKGLRLYLQENNTEFTSCMIEYICEFYTEAFKELSDLYSKNQRNKEFFEYRMVHRFLRCNFREYDKTPDIDHRGVFNFEHVRCPLRGECSCEGKICNPKFNTKLSERELQVMELYYQGYKSNEIAEMLFISSHTVETHKNNSLKKLDLHSLSDFFIYAATNNPFTSKNTEL